MYRVPVGCQKRHITINPCEIHENFHRKPNAMHRPVIHQSVNTAFCHPDWGQMLAVICLLQLDAVVVHYTVSRYIPRLPGDQRQRRLLAVQIFQFLRITGAVDDQIVPFANQLQIIKI